ncbi:MAG: AtpZ/AtpI family protein [Pseudomonadota bacterium]
MPEEPRPRIARAGTPRQKLERLEQRIAAARHAATPKPRADKDKYAAMSLAWRMVVELVISVMVGAAMGWGLDSVFSTLPLFLIVFVLLGFAAGVRTVMRSAHEMQRKQLAVGESQGAKQDEGA